MSTQGANASGPECSRVRPSRPTQGDAVALPVPGCRLAGVAVGQSAAGERLVAWNDLATDRLEVSQWSGARTLGPPVTVTNPSGDVPSAWLTFSANGQAILFWIGGSVLGDSDGWSLRAAVRGKDGQWGPVNQLTGPNGAPVESALQTRTASDGTVYAAWTSQRSVDDTGAHLAVHVLRWTPDGGFSKVHTLDSNAFELFPGGSAVSAGGDLLLSWTRQQAGRNAPPQEQTTAIETADWPAAAPRPTPAHRLVAGSLSASGYGAAVQFDSKGNVFAAWQQRANPYVGPITVLLSERKRGGQFATPITLSHNDATTSEPPSLAVPVPGAALVTWPRSGPHVGTIGNGSARVAIITPAGTVRQQDIPAPETGPPPAQGPPAQLLTPARAEPTLVWIRGQHLWSSTCTITNGCTTPRGTPASPDPETLESSVAPESDRVILAWEQGGRVAATGRVLLTSIP